MKEKSLTFLLKQIIPLLIFGYALGVYYSWVLYDLEIKNQLHQILKAHAHTVRQEIDYADVVLHGAGNAILTNKQVVDLNLTTDELRQRIQATMGPSDEIAEVNLISPDGEYLGSSSDVPLSKFLNYNDLPEKAKALAATVASGKLTTTKAVFNPRLGVLSARFLKPIFSDKGKLLLIAEACLSFDVHIHHWDDVELHPGISLAAINREGYALFQHPLINDSQEASYLKPYNFLTPEELQQAYQEKPQSLVTSTLNPDDHRYLDIDFFETAGVYSIVTIDFYAAIKFWLLLIVAPTLLLAVIALVSFFMLRKIVHNLVASKGQIEELSAWQKSVLESSSYTIITTDLEGRITGINKAGLAMLKYRSDTLTNRVFISEIHDKSELRERAIKDHKVPCSEDAICSKALIHRANKTGLDEGEWTYVRSDDSTMTVFVSITPISNKSAETVGFMFIASDVSDKKQIQATLIDSQSRYHTLFDASTDGILLLRDGVYVECNPAAAKILGGTRDDIIGHAPQTMIPPKQYDGSDSHLSVLQRINDTIQYRPQHFEWLCRRFDGSEFDSEIYMNMVLLEGKPNILVTFRDITQRKQTEQQLLYQATHDLLTGLPNRTKLHDTFDELLPTLQESSKRIALMLLDLDRFKEINDTLGHHAGDDVLKLIAPRIGIVLAGTEHFISRLGGDEFAILLVGDLMTHEFKQYALSIAKALKEPFYVSGISATIGGSFGIACYPDHGDNSHELLRAADVAMYRAKRLGLGVQLYDKEVDDYSRQRLSFAHDLDRAIKRRQLVLHFQPKVDLTNGTVVGFEALVRWNHPEQGLLYPHQFLDIIELSDIIHAFTKDVLEMAIAAKTQMHNYGMRQPIAVNLSTRNLIDGACFKDFNKLLDLHDVPPSEIALELTESAIMHDPDAAKFLLMNLKKMGIEAAIDDFGTGYSSLSYLRHLPVSALKIDKSFVLSMSKNTTDDAIVRSMIALAHNLDLKVIAEGVETEEVGDKLKQMGCDEAQGFGICKPLPLTGLISWYIDYHKNNPEQSNTQ